jgi:hypothetical protein
MGIRFIERTVHRGSEKRGRRAAAIGRVVCMFCLGRPLQLPKNFCQDLHARAFLHVRPATSHGRDKGNQSPTPSTHKHTSQWAEEARFRMFSILFRLNGWFEGIPADLVPQIPQARLVAGWWLVLPAQKLEGQHVRPRPCHGRYYRISLEVQRRARVS